MLSRCLLNCSVGVGVFVTGPSPISSFFSFNNCIWFLVRNTQEFEEVAYEEAEYGIETSQDEESSDIEEVELGAVFRQVAEGDVEGTPREKTL